MTENALTPAGRGLLDRRTFLARASSGLGGMALVHLLGGEGLLAADRPLPIRPDVRPEAPLAPRPSNFPPRAKQVVVIFCSGGVSHLDTWDYKPELIKRNGQPMPGARQLITFQGAQGNLAASPYPFKPRGQSGKYVSDLLPRLAELADEMCFIHSLTANSNTHGPAEHQIGTGFTLEGFPSMGSWVSYALGTESQNLPAFVAIPDPRGGPQTGPAQWSAGFLPAVFQGVPFGADHPIANLDRPTSLTADDDRATRQMLGVLNGRTSREHPGDSELAARISSYELAARMQLAAADVGDLAREPASIHALYGTDDANKLKAAFARNCLMARRLLERGVRFVQVFNGAYAMGEGVGNWDGHRTLKQQYDVHGAILDQPAAALLSDLKQRGMLDQTLVVWLTEFGRMPTFQLGASGRDHNPHGFTVWLAGAGVRRAYSHGATDAFGHKAVTDVATIYDLHATMLYLLGLDHQRLSFYHNGTERRLTDVHGRVLSDVLVAPRPESG